jgi:ribosomal protein S18 acetylase RimI-like enzyme
MMEYKIRPALASDLSRLMALDHTTRSDHVWQLELRRDAGQVLATFREVRLPRPITLGYPHDPFGLADEWKRMSMMYTAISGPDAVGYIMVMEQAPLSLLRVTDLVVAPQVRRQGVASALLVAAQDWASDRGIGRIMLEMQAKNLPAIRFAQKHGFEFCGYNDHYYLSQDVALFFVRALK